jgi:hypothetical protein
VYVCVWGGGGGGGGEPLRFYQLNGRGPRQVYVYIYIGQPLNYKGQLNKSLAAMLVFPDKGV